MSILNFDFSLRKENFMFAVISEDGLEFLSRNNSEAIAVINSHSNWILQYVNDLQDLESKLSKIWDKKTKPTVSNSFSDLTNKLDELGLNQELADKIRSNGEKLIGDVKSLGVKGMKTVGEGFVALGELLRKAADEPPEDHSENCCGLKH